MIYRYLSFIFLIFYAELSLAQVCGQASGITTNPDAPINPECNGSFLNTPFLNGIANPYYLDWRSDSFANAFTNNPPLMPSPFFETNNIQLAYLWDDLAYPDAPDISPQDGWELIDKRVDATEQNLIYFILYNKYTGILRVLAAANRTEDYNFVNVKVEFTTNFSSNGVNAVAATLSANNNLAQPLDRTTDVINVVSVAAYPNNNDMWFHADFPIAYDMCTCAFMSQLKVSFAFVTESHISMAGRSVAVTQNLNSIADGAGSIDPDFLTSLNANGLSQNTLQTQSGALIYKSFSSLVAHYKAQKEIKAKLEKDYAPWKLTKDILDGVSGLGIIPDGVGQFTILKNIFKGRIPRSATTPPTGGTPPPITPSKWTGITLGPNDLIKGAAFLVDKMSAPLKAKVDAAGTRIANLGMTTITQSEMTFRGTITSEIPIGSGALFKVPGAYKVNSALNCNASNYPMYNEVLGRFALIETPKVVIENQSLGYDVSKRVKRYALKIDPNIKYKFNPAANINTQETTIDAAIIIKIKLDNSASVVRFFNTISDTTFACRNLYTVSVNDTRDSATFITPFVPLSCIGQLIPLLSPSALGINIDYNILEVNLRLLIGYQFNNPNGLNRALEVLTYPTNFNYSEVTVDDKAIPMPQELTNSILTGNINGINNFPPVPYNTTNTFTANNSTTTVTYTLPALGINNQPIYNDLNLQTTNYTTSQTIFAWNGITINGDLTTAPGVSVEIIAPDIIIESGSVSPNITLRNADFPFSCPPISEWNGNVSAHCSSALYKASSFRPSAAPIVNENIIEPHSNQVAMSAVPNPFNEQVQIDFNLPTESPINLAVYNILGEQVDVLVSQTNYNSGNNSFTWNASNLPAGLYFVTLQGNDFRKTIKVIKQ